MLDTTDLKKGVKLELDGKPYIVIKSDFTNPGKGSAFVTVKIKNLETGQTIERNFKSGVKTGCNEPNLDEKKMAYMYKDAEGFNFMDQVSFETITIPANQIGESEGYLKEGMVVTVLYYNGRSINIDLPNFVELKVTSTDPGLKGDTASGGSKKAIMETGLQVNVPLFIKEGEILKIDTREGMYMERVKG
jgi:elongation factor P